MRQHFVQLVDRQRMFYISYMDEVDFNGCFIGFIIFHFCDYYSFASSVTKTFAQVLIN